VHLYIVCTVLSATYVLAQTDSNACYNVLLTVIHIVDIFKSLYEEKLYSRFGIL